LILYQNVAAVWSQKRFCRRGRKVKARHFYWFANINPARHGQNWSWIPKEGYEKVEISDIFTDKGRLQKGYLPFFLQIMTFCR